MKYVVCTIASLLMLGVVCQFFPLFHIVSLNHAETENNAAIFDAVKFADVFWTEKLLKSFDRATDAKELLAAINNGPTIAQTKYAHTITLGGGCFYYLRGEGRVLATNSDGVSLVVSANATNAEFVLETGLIFGNAVRDGTGLLNASDYPNSQDFNNISAELDKLVETHVLPKLRADAFVGAKVKFVGCAEVDDDTTDSHPLQVIPIQAEVE
jgi:predicted lipoprotein